MPRHEKDFKLTEGEVLAVRHLARCAAEDAEAMRVRTYERVPSDRPYAFRATRTNTDYWYTDVLNAKVNQKKTELAMVQLLLYIAQTRVEAKRRAEHAQVDR